MTDHQPEAPADPAAGAKAITKDELATALTERLRRCRGSHLVISATTEAAAEIFEMALSLREPEPEPGEIYRDARGDFWLYKPPPFRADSGSWGGCPWLKPGSAGLYGYGTPERPLRKLVPAPARDAIYVTLANGIERENCDQLTSRIVRLLEGSDER